jgi:hypothetical protein
MKSHRLTRRSFVVGGVASAAAVAVGFEPALKTAAATADADLIVGRFGGAHGPRSATVSVAGGRSVPVTLDAAAFVMHGADGVVESVNAFVPDERVVVVGAAAERGFVAAEFQSVYTGVSGTVAVDDGGHVLLAPSGLRVRIPDEVAQRDAPAGLRRGSNYFATIWTDPITGEATAVDLSVKG